MLSKALLFGAFLTAASASPLNTAIEDKHLARRDNIPKCGNTLPTVDGSGETFCLSKWADGIPITLITGYKQAGGSPLTCDSKGPINRIEIRYADGSTDYVGGDGEICSGKDVAGASCQFCEAGHLELGESETLKGWSTTRAAWNTEGVGKIYLETDRQWTDINYDAIFEDGPKTYVSRGGIVTGITGRFDKGVVTQFVPRYTTKGLSNFEVGKVVYDADALKAAKVNLKYVYKTSIDGAVNQTFSFNEKVHKESSYSVQESNTFSFGYKVSFSAGMDVGVVKATVGSEWSLSTGYTNTRTSGTTFSQEFSSTISGPLASDQVVNCYIAIGSYTGSIPFTRDVTLSFDGGEKRTYTRKGMVNFQQLNGDAQLRVMACPPSKARNPDPAGLGPGSDL